MDDVSIAFIMQIKLRFLLQVKRVIEREVILSSRKWPVREHYGSENSRTMI